MLNDEYMNIEAEVVDPPPDYGPPFSQFAMHYLNETANAFCNATPNCSQPPATPLQPRMDYDQLVRVVSVVVPILFGLIVVVGFIGNTLVVVVVLCNPQMRSTTNVLIINLAVADLLFIMFCVPFTAFDYAIEYWPFGEVWCKIVQYLIIVCAYTSIYTLVLMSLDRFLAVVHPITSMSVRTVRNALIATLVVWVVILVVCVPNLYAHGQLSYRSDGAEYSVCVFLAKEGYNYAASQISFLTFSYAVPLGVIFVLYMLMLKRLWFGVAPGGRVSRESLRSKRRVTRMVVVVVVIFAVCWCPVQIILLMKSCGAYDITPARLIAQIAAQCLAYTNSCVNPILYAFLSDNFRKAFRRVVGCVVEPSTRHPPSTRTTHDNNRETTLNNGTASRATTNATSSNCDNDIL